MEFCTGPLEIEKAKLDCADAWLRKVRGAASRMRAISELIADEGRTCDNLRAQRYDAPRKASMVHGDDAMFAAMQQCMERLQRSVAELGECSEEWQALETGAKAAFLKLECNPCACEIMTYRWLMGWPWWKIAREVGYSESRVKHIAHDARLECHDLMPIEYRLPVHAAM